MPNKVEFCIMPSGDYTYKNKRFWNSERHEIFFGGRNRQKSIDDGLIVFLLPEQHRGTEGVHGKNGHEFDLYLKQKGQEVWMNHYNKTEDDFRKRFGRSYL